MRSIIIATVLIAMNVSVLVGTVVFTRHEIQQAKFDAQREAMTRVLTTSFTTDYVIPVGEYKGEFASGICLDADAGELAIQYAL
jgi:Na+-translocating ferredoxin:NAD+ oxidoreductase RnfG subunit